MHDQSRELQSDVVRPNKHLASAICGHEVLHGHVAIGALAATVYGYQRLLIGAAQHLVVAVALAGLRGDGAALRAGVGAERLRREMSIPNDYSQNRK